MTIVNNLKTDGSTAAIPLPIVLSPSQRPSAIPSPGALIGSFPSFQNGTNFDFVLLLNQLLRDVANLTGNPGPAVLSGLALDSSSGLLVTVSDGIAVGNGLVYGLDIPDFAANDNARTWVWIKQDGTIGTNTSETPPSGSIAFLGSVVASSGAVTEISDSGVIVSKGGVLFRKTADRGEPVDTPDASLSLHTLTAAGHYQWNGESHKPIGISVNTESISATRPLLVTDAERQYITPTGADRKVLVPSSVRLDKDFIIYNAATSGSHNVVVRDSGDTTTLATLANGQKGSITAIAAEYIPV